MVHGLGAILPPGELTVIVNTGDDFIHYGLNVSPDLDTVCYTLAGLVDPVKGWGIKGDTYHLLERLKLFGGPGWFMIGDADFCTHLERTRRIHEGQTLTEVTATLTHHWGIGHTILPMTDDQVLTFIKTREHGLLSFQEFFVKYQFEPIVDEIIYQGLESARPTREVIQSLEECDGVVICPSNPFLSIDPIIKLRGIKDILLQKQIICVSPIIQNKCVKGPLSKILVELGYASNLDSIIRHYQDLLGLFIYDQKDVGSFTIEPASGIMTYATDILIPDLDNRIRLANEIIGLFEKRIGYKNQKIK